jgi:hypothetical protein
MPIHIAETTRKALCKVLGVSRLIEVMDHDFQDISPNADADRDKAALYADGNQGSVRLNAGRYYTVREYTAHVRKVKSLELP